MHKFEPAIFLYVTAKLHLDYCTPSPLFREVLAPQAGLDHQWDPTDRR